MNNPVKSQAIHFSLKTLVTNTRPKKENIKRDWQKKRQISGSIVCYKTHQEPSYAPNGE